MRRTLIVAGVLESLENALQRHQRPAATSGRRHSQTIEFIDHFAVT